MIIFFKSEPFNRNKTKQLVKIRQDPEEDRLRLQLRFLLHELRVTAGPDLAGPNNPLDCARRVFHAGTDPRSLLHNHSRLRECHCASWYLCHRSRSCRWHGRRARWVFHQVHSELLRNVNWNGRQILTYLLVASACIWLTLGFIVYILKL